MKNNTKSSITLPASELQMVLELMEKLNAKSKVEIIRRGLTLLKESTDRKSLRESFKKASLQTRVNFDAEMKELDNLDEDLD